MTVELVRALLPTLLFVLLSLLAYVKAAIVLQVLRRGLGGSMPPLLVNLTLQVALVALFCGAMGITEQARVAIRRD